MTEGDLLQVSSRRGTVQLIDRKTGKSVEMLHGFKAPYDAVRLADGSKLSIDGGQGAPGAQPQGGRRGNGQGGQRQQRSN